MSVFKVEDPIRCADGFEFSVQASGFHYCSPRVDNAQVYEKLEVGYQNQVEELLGETDDGHVWGYVPAEKIRKIIAKHGGSGNIPERFKESIG